MAEFKKVKEARRLFGVLANESRLELLRTLQKGELNVTQLINRVKISQTLVSHHLKTLMAAKLIVGRRQGNFRLYRLNGIGIAPFLQMIGGKAMSVDRSEAAVRKAEYDYRAIIDHLPAMVWMFGDDGTVEYCNRFWRDYTGQPLEKGLDAGWRKSFSAGDDRKVAAQWKKAVSNDKWSEIVVSFKKDIDDKYYKHLVRIAPLIGPDGRPSRWIGIATEVHGLPT